MVTNFTCLARRRWPRLLSVALGLLGGCGDGATLTTASTVFVDAGVWQADAALVAADGGLLEGGFPGGGTAGGGLTDGGLTGGGTTGGGTTGGGTTGGGTTGGGFLGGTSDAGADVGPEAGLADAGPGGGAGFPRSGEAVNVVAAGPYMVDKYDGPADPVFDSSVIYYPLNAIPPFAITALSPGFANLKEDFDWWGPVMASHGFVIIVISPTDALDFPAQRADDLEAAIALLEAENLRSGSPLLGKLDVERAGLMGHSMGGGATLLVMARSGSRYRAAVAWEPYANPIGLDTSRISAPTMILAGEFDLVAGANDMAWPFYQQIPSTTTKAYAEFAGFGHNTPNNAGRISERELHAKWTLAWMKMQLENDARYDVFVKNATELSRFGRLPPAQY
jgi:pimeloyl-ACP methyl ester carboxylesterase